MRRSFRILTLIMITSLTLMLCGCNEKTEVTLSTSPDKLAESDLAYKGEITIASACRHDPKYGDLVNASADVYNELTDIWNGKHPDIKLSSEYMNASEIAGLARMGELPDIVLLDSQTAGVLYKHHKVCSIDKELILNGTEDDPNNIDLSTYTRYGEAFAFPALCESYTVVIYDGGAMDSFPATLGELKLEGKAAKKQGYDALIAWPDKNGGNAVYSILSPQLALQKGGRAWLSAMSEGDRTRMLTDDVMLNAMDRTSRIMGSGVFSDESSEMDAKDAMKAFYDGKYPAIMVSGSDIYKTLETVKEKDPELYERLEFAALPVSNDADRVIVPCGTSTCLLISTEVASDPDKTKACLDLCQYLTGKAYADEMAASYGMNAFAKADDKAYEQFRNSCDDEVLIRLSEYTQSIKKCQPLTL